MGSVSLGKGGRSLWAAEPELGATQQGVSQEQLEGRPDGELARPAGRSAGA